MASKLQTKTIKAWEKEGWFVMNLITTNKIGIPDLLCLKKNEVPTFIEVKEKRDRVSKLQGYMHRVLIKAGFIVIIEKG